MDLKINLIYKIQRTKSSWRNEPQSAFEKQQQKSINTIKVLFTQDLKLEIKPYGLMAVTELNEDT